MLQWQPGLSAGQISILTEKRKRLLEEGVRKHGGKVLDMQGQGNKLIQALRNEIERIAYQDSEVNPFSSASSSCHEKAQA